jgi:hypothetical protein
MFERNVTAIYGYDNGGANLEGASPGQKVFAYVNGNGIAARLERFRFLAVCVADDWRTSSKRL